MGNGSAKLMHCFSGDARRRHVAAAVTSEPYDEGLGHSFCYIRPDALAAASTASFKVHHSEETTTFRTISGASVSANAATSLSTALADLVCPPAAAAAFESSTSFSSVPLQPIPRFSSGPLSGPIAPTDGGFLSGPIERGFMSGPLDHRAALFSGPLDRAPSGRLPRSRSHGLTLRHRSRRTAASLLRGLTKGIARTISSAAHVIPVKRPKESNPFGDRGGGGDDFMHPISSSGRNSVEGGEDSDLFSAQGSSLQWAQGKAGEDRVHIVVSEEHEWVFVGIYDGFNGPDATDYLLSNLYSAVQRELKGLLWEDKLEGLCEPSDDPVTAIITAVEEFDPSTATETTAAEERRKEGKQRKGRKVRGSANKRLESQRRWRFEWNRESRELDRTLEEQLSQSSSWNGAVNHVEVLKALFQALRRTEESYLDIADKMVSENPELALMGSCVLVMLMKGEDVYLMNVGDSRAILAQKAEPDSWSSMAKESQDLERINEGMLNVLEAYDCRIPMDGLPNLAALQLTIDHSTCVEEEVRRIRNEHPDDASAIANDRVKGSLKVTRAFGAGFLKQPKWNNALLEMFRIDYVGTSPYISCNPSLYHYKLSPKDRFLILSSDGLYQYFTNEEAVAQVEMFIATTPEGDPAQHLVEEVLLRAAKKAGMDFHELLEIPQGDRRRYHDDVSIIVLSLEGRIWRSCM
ncbi:probable protein phosphatase 2C 4 [Elaeis guineensis]|uniref:protein-serine/threonine phosphatase n=1 Tax=Elaeis guineensis var. tenera TaxID=51953 RepID=A0A6I9RRG9_ELAGV|nr:probable protein phosphatase 2C 4 [Elaeis guineensis]